MTRLLLTIALFLMISAGASALEPEYGLDSNTAFYEGESLSYTMSAPDGFRLVLYKAKFDGYSFAFIPEDELYDSASVIIGVHIYKIRGMKFDDALKADTTALRNFYGPNLALNAVPSVTNATRQTLPTFYLNDTTRFIPNVMMSYFDGGTEMLVLELVITPGVLRFEAEESFMGSVRRFKALKKGQLSQN